MTAFVRLTDAIQLVPGLGTASMVSITVPVGANSYIISNPNLFDVRVMGGADLAQPVSSTTGYLIMARTEVVYSLITPGGPTSFSALAVDSPYAAASANGRPIEVHFGTGE